MNIRNRHDSAARGAPSRTVPVGVLIMCLFCGGCASHSVGKLPLQQETVAARCPRNAIKECVVSGGNRFRKRYEYCGCRETGLR